MSDPKTQSNSSQDQNLEGNDQAPKPSQSNAQNEPSDKDKNFELVRKQLADKDKLLAKYEKERADADNEKLKAEGKLQELLDKTTKEKTDLETKYQIEKRQTILEKELAKSGVNAELVDLILPAIFAQVEFDDSNAPKNLTEVLENLKTSKPSLFAPQSPNIPAGKIGIGVTSTTSNQPSQDEIMRIIQTGNADLISKLNL